MMAHGLLYVGKGNLSHIEEQTAQNQPDSWKGYNIRTPRRSTPDEPDAAVAA